MFARIPMLVAVSGLIMVSLGCQSPAGSVQLTQPQLQGWQQELRLQSNQIRWAGAGDTAVERVVAEFPLPGAVTGRPTYLLYLRLPAGESNVSFAADASPGGRGFFIQTRGEYAGLARLTGGTVEVRGTSKSQAASRRLTLDVLLEDGSRLSGEIEASRDEYFVSRFENRRHPADVQALLGAPRGTQATQPAR